MKISFSSSSGVGACLIAFISKNSQKKASSSPLGRLVDSTITDKLFDPKKPKSLFIPHSRVGKCKHLLLVGVSEALTNEVTHEAFRQAGAIAYRQLEQHSLSSAEVDLSLCDLEDKQVLVRALTEGFTLAYYNFEELKQKSSRKKSVKSIFFTGGTADRKIQSGLQEGKIIAESTNFARQLGDTPANLMTPTLLAQSVQEKFKGLAGVQVTVWNKERIKKEKMGGLIGVSLGSQQEPRMIKIEYKGSTLGSGKSNTKPLCFVGKGLTFDSGGISLKPPKDMHEMKFDMCGSVAVIGALLAMARLKLKVDVIGLVGSTENMPGAAAVKPGDILRARNGKTMEVLNTDAEGRLVLADILSYACEQKPQFIVDAATLTGAIFAALGNVYTGAFTRNKDMEKLIQSSADLAGEKVWFLPLNNFNVKDIKGVVGDVSNISPTKGAGSSTAAAFLEHFVDKKIPWAHLDIAGTAWNVSNRLAYCRPHSASGVMVRTFVEMAKQYC